MEILVLLKQVPDELSDVTVSSDLKVEKGSAKLILDPVGKNALELAVSLKEAHGGSVQAVCVGPASSKTILKEAVSVGADKGVQVVDEAFDGSDPIATAQAVAKVAQKLGPFDLIVTGVRSYDGGSGLVAPTLARLVGLPQVTTANQLVSSTEDSLELVQLLEKGQRTVEVTLPAVVSVDEYINKPRYASVKTKLAANKAKFEALSAADLGLEPVSNQVVVKDVSAVPARQSAEMISGGSADEIAQKIVSVLQNDGLI